jgi:multicomponent Na+:H+ antiporter subunit C
VDALFAITVAALVGSGVYAALQRNLIRVSVGLSLLLYGVNLFVLAAGQSRGHAPIRPIPEGATASDPLVQALVLTAVVIGAGTTAVLVGLVHRVFTAYGTLDQSAVADPKEPE